MNTNENNSSEGKYVYPNNPNKYYCYLDYDEYNYHCVYTDFKQIFFFKINLFQIIYCDLKFIELPKKFKICIRNIIIDTINTEIIYT